MGRRIRHPASRVHTAAHRPCARRARGALLLAASLLLLGRDAAANHIAREDPSEPIFTQRAFVERNLELDVGLTREDGDAGETLETTVAGTWVFARRWQLGLEIPTLTRFPPTGPAVAGLGDVAPSLQVLLCCEERMGWRFLSVRAEAEAPTGDRRRDLDGTGSFMFSLLAGNGFTVVRALQDLGVQVQLAYTQEIRLSDEERETAADLGRSRVREKAVLWNVALTQPLFGGRLTPVLELLGSTVVDAVDPGDEGTRVQVGAGFWTAPFADDGVLSALSLAAGWRFPVTGQRDDRGAGLLIAEWAFD